MDAQSTTSLFSVQISTISSKLDEQVRTVLDSPTGRELEFRMGRIIESLLNSGLDYYQALAVLRRVEGQLRSGMETKDISSIIATELEAMKPSWATEFRIRYGEGVTIVRRDSSKVSLCTVVIRDIAKSWLATTAGYDWGRLLPSVTQCVVGKCQRLGMPSIPCELVEQLLEQELRSRMDGLTISEYREEMPSIVASCMEKVQDVISTETSRSAFSTIIPLLVQLCKALLFYFGIIPPDDPSECVQATIALLDRARSTDDSLHVTLSNFKTAGHYSPTILTFFEKRKFQDFVVQGLKAVLRKASGAVVSEEIEVNSQQPKEVGLDELVVGVITFLAEFLVFLWPEDWLAASTLQKQRHDVLRNLFRYRCLSVIKLTRALQVHPKHILRALGPLEREGLVVTHHLKDGELVLITTRGEQYCEQHLGLKLRCTLSSL